MPCAALQRAHYKVYTISGRLDVYTAIQHTPAEINESTLWIRSVLAALAIHANKNLIAIYLSEE